MKPDALVLLANLGRPRRPPGAHIRRSESVLPDPATATGQLATLVARRVTEADLPALRRVQQVALQTTEALLAGEPPDDGAINTLAHGSTAHIELAATSAGLHQYLVWNDTTIAAGMARRIIEELAALEPDRLRRCARTECNLLFYDTTRSRTRRWHAEDPCGWRQRQHRHRTHS